MFCYLALFPKTLTGPLFHQCSPNCFSCPPLGSVPVALAVAACILALLSLPLILLLVYKQRQNGHSSRRTYRSILMHQFSSVAFFETCISPTGALINALSDTHFLPVQEINCISHTVPLQFLHFTMAHFPFPLSQVHRSWWGWTGKISHTLSWCLCATASKHSCPTRPNLFSYTQSNRKKKRNILI